MLNCFNYKTTKIKCTYFSDLNSSTLILNIYFLFNFLLNSQLYIYIYSTLNGIKVYIHIFSKFYSYLKISLMVLDVNNFIY